MSQRQPMEPAGRGFDNSDVRDIARAVSLELAARLAAERNTDGGEYATSQHQRDVGTQIAQHKVIAWSDGQRELGRTLTADQERLLLDGVLAALFGLGRLQTYIDDPDVENVMVRGHQNVRVEYADTGGLVVEGQPVADSDKELIDLLTRAAADNGQGERTWTPTKPTLHLRLGDGSRLAAMAWVTPWPTVVIRRHRTRDVDLDEMIRLGSFDAAVRDFLRAAMAARMNIMIAGLQMSGKTTLLRAMAAEIPEGEWFATMENEYELHLHETGRHRWVVPIEAREGHGDRAADGRPAGEISIGDLLPDMLRMSMTRVIVGEVRSSEIVPMLRAMGTSRGSLCTIHARSAYGVFDRIVELALEYGTHMTEALAHRLTGNALDYIVYAGMDEVDLGGGRYRRVRRITHIVEIDGIGEGGRPTRNDIFGPGEDGRAIPLVAPSRTAHALRAAGLDMAMFGRHSWGSAAQGGRP